MRILSIVQLLIAVLLTVSILLQHRSSSMGMSFGGGGMDGSYYTRRGFEKFLVQATVALAIAFAAVSLAQILV